LGDTHRERGFAARYTTRESQYQGLLSSPQRQGRSAPLEDDPAAAVTLGIRQWGKGPYMLEPHEGGKAGMSPHLPEGGVLRTQSLGKFLPDQTPGIRIETVEPGIGKPKDDGGCWRVVGAPS